MHRFHKSKMLTTEAELMKLQEAVSYYPKHMAGYWAKVTRLVGTRSAEECHFQHTSQGTSQTPPRAKNPEKERLEAQTKSLFTYTIVYISACQLIYNFPFYTVFVSALIILSFVCKENSVA